MATGTRSSSKRKRKAEAESSEIEESPSNPTSPTKRGRKKKATRQKNREQEDDVQEIPPETGEDSGSKSDADKQRDDRPSGYPFTTEEVEWKFVRLGQLKQAKKKIIPGGYEGLCGEVNDLLKGLKHQVADKVRYSAMGEFTRLDNNATRNGNMLHYVLCHQVIPDPAIDDTALYFKIGRRVVRFSREEYALVSGLKFGPANFNPYTAHDIPPNSTFSRLFGENPDTTLSKLRTAANAKKFMVDGKSVKATPDDWVKICKLLLCLGFVFGVDGCKKKIPTWMWVLLENEDEWENFPWGSISFQILLDTIKGITTKTKQEGMLNINFKGNTVAFSAWIFEAIPAFGEAIGLKKDEHEIPRFMEYSYTTSRVWPTDKQIKKRVLRMLKPRTDEKVSPFWKSLELDPTPHPFAFQYDPTDSMKGKRKAEEDDDEEAVAEPSGPQIATSSSVLIAAAAEATITKNQAAMEAAMKAVLEDYHQNTLKAMLAENHKNLLDAVAEKVTNLLLDRATTDNAYNCGSDVRDALGSLDPMADTQNTVPSTPLEKSQVSEKVVISTPATTKVVAVEESTTIPTGALESPGNSLFSLGVNFNASQDEGLVPVSVKSAVQAATGTSAAAASTGIAAASTEIPAAAAAPIAQTATTQAPAAGGTTAAPAEAQTATPTANLGDGGQGFGELDDGFSDTQINRVFDTLPILTRIGPLDDVQRAHDPVRPLRKIYPSRAVRSPFLREDKRPKPDEFKAFMKKGKATRNVGLPLDMGKEFFRAIKQEKNNLMEDHVNCYLGVLVSNPVVAGFTHLDRNVGITCCFFMCEVERVFEEMHKGKKLAKGGFDHDSFDPSEEEVIPAEDMEKLVAFADGTYPPWGDHVREWTDFEKVIAVCYFDEEWATVEINFGNQQLVIHDPRSSEFKDEDIKKRLDHFIAMSRLVPQIMKEIGGFQKRNIRIPQYGQWEIVIAPPTAPESDIWRAKKNKSDSTLYCLRYVEKMLARGPESPHLLRNNDELKAYRHHIAQAIFNNSTEPVPLQQLVEGLYGDATRLF